MRTLPVLMAGGSGHPLLRCGRWNRRTQLLGQSHRSRGFTIVELIVVLVLLGVLSVTAFSRFVKPSAFAPGIVIHALVLEARAAQQLATSRADAVVTLRVDRSGDDWRLRLETDVDGVLREERVGAANTTLAAVSGAASGTVDASSPLILRFDARGDLAAVLIGAAAGDPALGISLSLSGDSAREACVYPSGYATDATCA